MSQRALKRTCLALFGERMFLRKMQSSIDDVSKFVSECTFAARRDRMLADLAVLHDVIQGDIDHLDDKISEAQSQIRGSWRPRL